MVLTPAATAMLASRLSRPLCARWPATRDEEQAVSVLTQGPVSPNVYDTLAAHSALSNDLTCSPLRLTAGSMHQRVEETIKRNGKTSCVFKLHAGGACTHLPAMKLRELPVAVDDDSVPPDLASTSAYSWYMQPT